MTNWLQASDFELRSCLQKRRYSREPALPSMMFRAYHCGFCGGWHLATKKDPANGPPPERLKAGTRKQER